MKLIASEQGQVLLHVIFEELRPLTGVFPPDFVAKIVNRYSFVKYPTDLFDADQNGYKFSMGKLSGDRNNILQFDLYRDGLIAIGRHTNIADIVIDDFIEWSVKEFKFHAPVITPYRTYSSNVIVEFDRSAEFMFKEFGAISSTISSAYQSEPLGYKGDLRLWRVALMADPGLKSNALQSQFLLERRANISADRERYFSAAPLPTDKHLRVLEEIERSLMN